MRAELRVYARLRARAIAVPQWVQKICIAWMAGLSANSGSHSNSR